MALLGDAVDHRLGEAIPRDTSRFKKLYPNGRAVIKDDADKTLGCISTIEIMSNQTKKV